MSLETWAEDSTRSKPVKRLPVLLALSGQPAEATVNKNCHNEPQFRTMVTNMKQNLSLRAVVRILIVLGLAGLGLGIQAQTPTPSPTPAAQTPAAVPPANPADVATMDSIIASLYDVISGGPGPRNWVRFRSLFVPGARLIPTGRRPTGEVVSRSLTPDEYIQRSAPLLEKDGFFEREVARRTERFGNIAHLLSTYESRHKSDDPNPFARGINSIQLMNDGKRWWIVTVFWQAEDEKNPLPAEYLKSRN